MWKYNSLKFEQIPLWKIWNLLEKREKRAFRLTNVFLLDYNNENFSMTKSGQFFCNLPPIWFVRLIFVYDFYNFLFTFLYWFIDFEGPNRTPRSSQEFYTFNNFLFVQGEVLQDGLCSCCCGPCANCQIASENKSRKN